ncbi:hypothetical protein CHU92_01370 [Flavobacterium cyanobacteriorum]|uniref:Hemolysin III n=1 Tax=Flavobacterium cyanobacteriorum TaxID=2022802 RepID=A0A256A053_9FLAO|nr:hypothetical protein [Flavobacterium cyanobacteriorum]OYQ46504.1 hypothetical protein CHU92_01370 [Flavobacterium cyanobacteriorum]
MQIHIHPPDGGILYTETNMQQLFPEPLNAVTSVLFLLLAFYWTVKLWGRAGRHTFLSFALVLLYIGGIGGTIYHGLRKWSIFIVMDWLPIMLLCLSAGIYFLVKVTRWYFALALLCGYAAFMYFLRVRMAGGNVQFFININYAVLASVVLIPVLAHLIKTGFRNGKWVGIALLAFVVALMFRVADSWGWLTSGTHFLWHVFGALAAFCMFRYIYLINESSEAIP